MSNWHSVSLAQIVKPIERAEIPVAGKSYRQVGVKLWGVGAYERETIDGGGTQYKTLSRVEADDIIVNKIWARNGSVAVVPTILAGCYVSGEFPTFTSISDKLDPQWFHWITKTQFFWDQCDAKSRGTSGKNRIRPERFLEIEIPLPSLSEQRRIVARIKELADKINEARALRRHAVEEAGALLGAQLGVEFSQLANRMPLKPLGELSSYIVDGPHVTPTYLLDGVDGIPFVTVKNMVSGKLDFSDINCISRDDHILFSKRCRAEYGDVLYSKDGATRGRPCFVDTDQEFSFFVSVALVKPLRDQLDGRYLVHLLNSNWIKDRMAIKSRGDMIPHIVLREIRAFPVPILPLVEQHRIVAKLDAVQAKVDGLEKLQAQTSLELDALLPSILDKAFNGKL
jgi:type I restriction enzyme, S subunit